MDRNIEIQLVLLGVLAQDTFQPISKPVKNRAAKMLQHSYYTKCEQATLSKSPLLLYFSAAMWFFTNSNNIKNGTVQRQLSTTTGKCTDYADIKNEHNRYGKALSIMRADLRK